MDVEDLQPDEEYAIDGEVFTYVGVDTNGAEDHYIFRDVDSHWSLTADEVRSRVTSTQDK